MQDIFIQDKTFNKIEELTKGEYENCTFTNCNFGDIDFSDYTFIDCSFVSCNLSLCKVNHTAMRDVIFKDCKLLGIQFDTCHDFGLSFSFETCNLKHASFYKTKIKKTIFKNSQLEETDFSECDLSAAIFDHCNLAQAIFHHTNLEKADFSSSYNYSIDPEINRIKKAKFSIEGITGLLDKYDIIIEK